MAKTRTSVELHPGGWRLVEVQISASGRRAVPGEVRVVRFASGGTADAGQLADLLGRIRQERRLEKDAWVTLWGLRSVQHLVRLPPAKPDAIEALALREARKEIAPFESPGEPASVAIVQGSEMMVGSARRREVSLVAVASADVRTRIQPLVDAGFVVRGVSTPALAMAALARSRADLTPGTAAYATILRDAICLAIVRDGVLLFAREMAWGHADDDIAGRLASELKRSILFFKQTFRAPVEALVLGGDMPNLRALTGPLGEALGLSVQPLDSLVGIDAAAVPEPAEQFRAEAAALRLVIATGADPAPRANLLPTAIRKLREAHVVMVRFVAAVVASVLLTGGWYYLTRETLASQRAELEALQRELAILDPDAARLAELRQAYSLTTSRQAALSAFDSQGPRLARVLEVLATATPENIVLTTLRIEPAGPFWQAHLGGTALSSDPVLAQEAVTGLLQAMADSPFIGQPSGLPSFDVISGTGTAQGASGTRALPIPPGMTGVDFRAEFRLAK